MCFLKLHVVCFSVRRAVFAFFFFCTLCSPRFLIVLTLKPSSNVELFVYQTHSSTCTAIWVNPNDESLTVDSS